VGHDRQREPSGERCRDADGGEPCIGGAAQTPALASEPTVAGEQTLVPGVAPVSMRQRLELRMLSPLQPTKLQKPLDIGLFDLAARNQFDLFG